MTWEYDKEQENHIAVGKDGIIYRVDSDGSLHIFWSERSGVRAMRRKDPTEPRKMPESHCPLQGSATQAMNIANMIDATERSRKEHLK